MTSRERVRRAINFQHPDRVPIDLGAMRASSINGVLYDKLKRHLGLHTPTKLAATMDLLAEVELPIVEKIGGDVLPVEAGLAAWAGMPASAGVRQRFYGDVDLYFMPGTNITREPTGNWLMRDKSGTPFAEMPKDGYYFDFIQSAMGSGGIDPNKFQPSATVEDQTLEAFARRSKFLHQSTDKALLGWGSGISFMGLSFLLSDNITQGSLDDWLIMLMTEKGAAHDMMARSTDAAIARTKLLHQAAGDLIDIWGVASDDAGTQRGGLIAGDLFQEMIAPHYKRLCDWVHKNTKWKTFLHSCGAVHDYLGPWIDAGIDIVNPVQISAANMEPERLMRDFGGRVVFWGGGCDTQHVLPLETPEVVRQHVRHNLEIFAQPQGGFVFTQVHNIQYNVPIENVLAMFDEARNFRFK